MGYLGEYQVLSKWVNDIIKMRVNIKRKYIVYNCVNVGFIDRY